MNAEPCFFEAVIVPHRSLSVRGLHYLVAALCTLSCITTAVFWWLGAWPIAGFNGVEITLALLLLRHNARGVRANEVLLLSDAGLRVIQTTQDGRRSETTVSPAWLRVDLQERPGRVSGLWLTAHGVRMEIAKSLGEDEKADLAQALRGALERYRNPRFDNPQLRD